MQKPLWCLNYPAHSCENARDYYFLGQLPYLTAAESLIYEVSLKIVILLFLYGFGFFLSASYICSVPLTERLTHRICSFAIYMVSVSTAGHNTRYTHSEYFLSNFIWRVPYLLEKSFESVEGTCLRFLSWKLFSDCCYF